MKRITAVLTTAAIGIPLVFFSLGTLFRGGLTKNPAEAMPLHEKLLQGYQNLSLSLGKDCIGNFYITDERIIPKRTSYFADTVQNNIDIVNSYADSLSAPFFWCVAPTSVGIYSDTLSRTAPQASEQVLLSTAAEGVGSKVSWIDVYGTMYGARDSYIYYRSDNRWTTYGAFCAYKTIIRKLGFESFGFDRYVIEHRCSDFRGAYSLATQYEGLDADVVDIYNCQDGAEIQSISSPLTGLDFSSLYQESAEGSPHQIFLPETEAILNLETGVHNDKSLLVLSDSYGSNFVPFLTQHYRTLTFVNMNLATQDDLREIYPSVYSQILLLCSADTLASDNGLALIDFT